MALNQLQAVTNRRIRPNIVAGINAQTPYLPQLYQQKADTAYRDKSYDQSERSLAQASDIAKKNEALAYKQLDEQKDQNSTAKKLGYANMGIGGLTGLAGLYQATKPMDEFEIAPSLSNVGNAISNVFSGGGMGSVGTPGAAGMGSVLDNAGGPGNDSLFGGVGDFVMDYAVEPLKQIGSSIWDAGSSFLDDIGGLFS